MDSEVQRQNVHTRATDLSAPESRRQVNDRFPSQTAEVEFASRCPVHEQTVTTNKQTTLRTLSTLRNDLRPTESHLLTLCIQHSMVQLCCQLCDKTDFIQYGRISSDALPYTTNDLNLRQSGSKPAPSPQPMMQKL